MVDQVKAMRSSIPKKQERKPPFFRGGGLQPQIQKGRSPELPLQGQALPDRERPITKSKEDSKLALTHVLPHCQTQMTVTPVEADSLPAAGRLKGHTNTWKVRTRDPWVVDTVRGYRIDFLSEPFQRALPHPPQYSKEQN